VYVLATPRRGGVLSDPMKILVTGAAGFIGYHTCEQLLARGDTVVGLDNLNDYYDVSLKQARLDRLLTREGDGPGQFRFHHLDLADAAGMRALFADEGFDRVITLAAQAGVRYSLDNPQAYVDSNVTGFLNVLEGCRYNDVQHLVYASTSSVYGANTHMPFTEHEPADHPLAIYGATKRANELMSHSYAHLFGLPCTGLRFFTVYGPWRLFNIGNNQPVQLLDYIRVLEECLGRKAEMEMLPLQAGDVPDTWASADDLKQAVGYQPFTPVEEGVRQFVEWYRDYYGI